mmetsp:Transcript_34224/g.89797  ORF Transcript_34224/g.89797 Transcript_34224/m.89797 type:complete len:932 (+) Transcript_34224:188-2983(+)|eukprot:CAMPEP_0182938830 /NCGR_PEP_ID=MMETSP0105_2-20130417/44571_1 /TAXON_ID=81532 ORGANISM="Acanthoeca-like sp., Strain 10tr" /NCGR_SAMPLE_ID=MMETSP0105_2 /ASSEMBLY_ACC=CAM_ASM_000205 /LENGTH=931 /DNA_ID=CAMNT_0025078177 /DNA_START=173 /DNA_END=2968 /DNA_ORIENTATION=-
MAHVENVIKAVNTDCLELIAFSKRAFRKVAPESFFPDDVEAKVLRTTTASEADRADLKAYKSVCDDLLPGLRSRSHLHNLIFRDKTNVSVVLRHRTGGVFGGCTFRLFLTGTRFLILDILIMAVCQQSGLSGRGHGTRLVNYVKELTLASRPVRANSALLVTQSDNSIPAINFWQKQMLEDGELATLVITALHRLLPQRNHVYESSLPMLLELVTPRMHTVLPTESKRAQRAVDTGAAIDCTCGEAHSRGNTLQCDFCGGRQHYNCVVDALGVAVPDVYICFRCAPDDHNKSSSPSVVSPADAHAAVDVLGATASPTLLEIVEDCDADAVEIAVAPLDRPVEFTTALTAGPIGPLGTTAPAAHCKDERDASVSPTDLQSPMDIVSRPDSGLPQVERSPLPIFSAAPGLTPKTPSDDESDSPGDCARSPLSAHSLSPQRDSKDSMPDDATADNSHAAMDLLQQAWKRLGVVRQESGQRCPPLPPSSGDQAGRVAATAPSMRLRAPRWREHDHRSQPRVQSHVDVALPRRRFHGWEVPSRFRKQMGPVLVPPRETERDSLPPAFGPIRAPDASAGPAVTPAAFGQASSKFDDPLALVWEMHTACDEDDEHALLAGDATRPTSCRRLLAEISQWSMAPPAFLSGLLNSNVLNAARRWLQSSSGSRVVLPHMDRRSTALRLLQAIQDMVSLAHLKRSGGLVRILRQCEGHPNEIEHHKRICRELIAKWGALLSQSGAPSLSRPPSMHSGKRRAPNAGVNAVAGGPCEIRLPKRAKMGDDAVKFTPSPLTRPVQKRGSTSGGESVSPLSRASNDGTPTSHGAGVEVVALSHKASFHSSAKAQVAKLSATKSKGSSTNCKQTISILVRSKVRECGASRVLSRPALKDVIQTTTRELAALVKRDFPAEYGCVPFIMPLKLAVQFDKLVSSRIELRMTK